MEKEEQKWEQEELEEEQEEEETSLQARKSRPVNETESTDRNSNGTLDSNGHEIQSSVSANGTKDFESTLENGEEKYELGGVAVNVEEISNGLRKSDNLVFFDEDEESTDQKSNGSLESNGNEIQSSVSANGAKDFESTLENEEEKDELGGVAGNVEEFSNGLRKSDNLVFFDEDEGIWKCRICSWIYGNGSACVDHMQSHKGQLHKLMNDKTLNNESGGYEFTPVSGDQQIEKSSGHNEVNILPQELKALHNSTSAVNGESKRNLNDDSLSYSNHQQNGILENVLTNSDLRSSGEIESEEVYIVPGDELEVTEIDVERVLQKQTTHDLHCPNCNSCITGRVILRKRKRRIRLSAQDIKRNKLEAVADSKLNADSFQVSSTVVHGTDFIGVDSAPLIATNDTDHDREPDLFRCLSCFSFFFPTGNGFKLFRIFEGKKVKVTVKEEQVPSTKKNWFTSMLAFSNPEIAVARGSKSREDVRKSDMGIVPSSDIIDHNSQPLLVQETHPPAQDSDVPVPRQGHTVRTKVLVGAVEGKTAEKIEATIERFEAYTGDQLQESKSGTEAQMNHGTNLSSDTPPKGPHFTNGESSADNISFSKDGMNLIISTNGEFLTYEKQKEGQIPHQKIVINKAEATVEHFEVYSSDQLQESKSGSEVQMNHGTHPSTKTPPKGTHSTNGKSSDDNISLLKGGRNLLISSNGEFMTFEKPTDNQKIQIDKDGEAIQIMATPVSIHKDVDGSLGISLAVPHEDQHVEATIVTESFVENKNTNFQSGDDGRVYPAEVSQHIVTKTKFEVHTGESIKIEDIPSIKGASFVQGKDTVITIDARSVGSSQTGQSIVYPEETISGLHSASQVTVVDAEGTEVRNEFEIEVIKSIVYGGLAESITSLGVVSSAAGGGAATLKILALGIASLIGGFFVICHNLWELRSECTEQAFNNHVSPVTEQRGRYKELLGRKENFVLHAIVCILSYIMFGLVAPVTYGFSFRKSDNKEFKLIVVAAASLLCICGLAVGRAYVRRAPRPYLKSVATYLILGFMVSGVSYVAGVLVERILVKLDLFHSSSGANLLLPQMETVQSYSGWTSY